MDFRGVQWISADHSGFQEDFNGSEDDSNRFPRNPLDSFRIDSFKTQRRGGRISHFIPAMRTMHTSFKFLLLIQECCSFILILYAF